MKKRKKLSGIDGWLLVFTFGLMIVTLFEWVCAIFYIIIIIFQVVMNSFTAEMIMEGLYFTFLSLLLSYPLYLIYKKDKKAPFVTIITLWIFSSISVIPDLLVEPIGFIILFYIPYLIILISWTLYWIKSKRVKNTFVN